ncbi:MAG TPA: PhzF family phenazine biosynthesis protein, partial [Planctomycetota bacterium]|nr:PhzF family phenazine biosynthesis protein [Planctomycetota bacterium]
AVGVDEDPVTGSAHSVLAPYWSERLGKTSMLGYQASPRGGEVAVKLRGDRVALGGEALTVVRGELVVR